MDIDQFENLYNRARSVGALDRHIGARLRSRRMLLQMSASWLADALGLARDELERMETGKLRIGPQRLAFMAVALDVADRYFFLDFVPTTVPEEKPRRGWLRDVDCWFRDRVSPHENLLLGIARRMVGSQNVARDVVHDAYASLMVDERWRTIDDPRAYLRAAVINLAGKLIARSRIVPIYNFDPASDVEDERPGPDTSALDRDHLRRVLAALEKLPPKSRRAMILRKVDGLTGPEIAKQMGITLKGVEIHITRGMVALNKHLEADDVGLGLGSIVTSKDKTTDTSIAD
jgi:RNA polymerase sigma-70 factor (ECF subfamily)